MHSNEGVANRQAFFVLGLLVAWRIVYMHPNSGNPRSLGSNSTIKTMSADIGTPLALAEANELEPKKTCSVWIARSSLKGVDGYGVFTTRDLKPGERILSSHDGISIPVEDYRHGREPHSAERRSWIKLWDNYWWERGIPDHATYEYPHDTIDFQIGFGSLPNHHCTLASLTYQYPDDPYHDAMVNRFRDAGTGAFSYNKGREFLVTNHIRAGEEIFLNYGYCDRDNGPSWIDSAHVPGDFEEAARIVKAYLRDEGPMRFNSLGNLELKEEVEATVAKLLPKTTQQLLALRPFDSNTDLEHKLAKAALEKRSPEWIRNNGICMESIIPKPSTVDGAGQGAFAHFRLARGEVIVPAPLIQIMDKKALNIYNSDGSRNGTQLLVNYCFGHNESSLLLCPNTNAVLINHCSQRTKSCGPDGPNADYRWAGGWDPTSQAWRKMTLTEIAEQDGRGLSFEIIALRDIAEGEEVLIDYGFEWEEAWKEHAASWRRPSEYATFVTAQDANNELHTRVPTMFISGDLRRVVKHPYLFPGCLYETSRDDSRRWYQLKTSNWRNMSDEQILLRYGSDGSRFMHQYENGYASHHDRSHWPCSVLKKQSDDRYIVQIHHAPFATRKQLWHKKNLPRMLYSYPRESIHFFVHPQTSDQHLSGVFRHPIGIRDEMFPEHWRNLA